MKSIKQRVRRFSIQLLDAVQNKSVRLLVEQHIEKVSTVNEY